MSHSWLTLTEDEDVLWTDHPSIYTHLQRIVLGLALVIGGVVIALSDVLSTISLGFVTLGDGIGILLGVLGVGIAGIDHLRRTSTVYVLTTNHVYKKVGILRRDVDPIRLDRIADIEYSQSLTDRLLGIGDIRIMTAGTGGKDMVLEDVPAVQTVAQQLSRELNRQTESTRPQS